MGADNGGGWPRVGLLERFPENGGLVAINKRGGQDRLDGVGWLLVQAGGTIQSSRVASVSPVSFGSGDGVMRCCAVRCGAAQSFLGVQQWRWQKWQQQRWTAIVEYHAVSR